MMLLIKNGTLVNAHNEFTADILVAGDRILQIAKHIPLVDDTVVKMTDATGMLVLPGGIDPHVHMHLPAGAGHSSDDFATGSKAALMGGTTTLIDFVTPKRGMSLTGALASRQSETEGSMTDYSFHVSPVEWTDITADEIRECVRAGLTSYKLYMAYKDAIGIDDGVMEKVMQVVADAGGIVTVHCETGDEIEVLRRELAEAGQLSPAAHPLSRPPHTESRAVERAIALAGKTACPLYIVHVSAAESVDHIRSAQTRGQRVMAEVCPQHLLLDKSIYEGPFEAAAPYVLSPPLRSEKDRKVLWQALQEGVIQTVGTDHCPFFMKQKEAGRDDFRKIANGAGGVEHRLALLYTFGVLEGKISRRQFVDSCAAQPAKIFGLYPQKGVIAEGSDADLVIWDPVAEGIISAKNHHQNSDINIYEGIKTRGNPKMVISKGQIVAEDGKFMGAPRGKFLKRS